jgi:hypothetical protein
VHGPDAQFQNGVGRDERGEHVQRNVKRSPGAASATRCRSSRSYKSRSPNAVKVSQSTQRPKRESGETDNVLTGRLEVGRERRVVLEHHDVLRAIPVRACVR